jgi:coenzyme PQQ precursor peptide PqqA
MDWEAPSFVEVKMDAEVNAYQDDFADFSDVQERPTEALVATNPQ